MIFRINSSFFLGFKIRRFMKIALNFALIAGFIYFFGFSSSFARQGILLTIDFPTVIINSRIFIMYPSIIFLTIKIKNHTFRMSININET